MSSTSSLPANNSTFSNNKFDIAIAAYSSLTESAWGNFLPDCNLQGVVVDDFVSLKNV